MTNIKDNKELLLDIHSSLDSISNLLQSLEETEKESSLLLSVSRADLDYVIDRVEELLDF